MIRARSVVAVLAVSAAGFLGILNSEGFRGEAYIPVADDVPTLGFGTTENVESGDTIDPVEALNRAMVDVNKFEGAVRSCVSVPLHQREYDAFVSLAYNIGQTAFCTSTLVKKVNSGDYRGACDEILRWHYSSGRSVEGLLNRRKREHKMCIEASRG